MIAAGRRDGGIWLIAQLAVWHTPRAVQIHLLTTADRGEEWEWIRWLPHARPDNPAGASEGVPPPQALPVGWGRLGYPVALRPVRDDRLGHSTDLHALVGVIRRAAEVRGIPTGSSPWLAPLPRLLGLDSLTPGGPAPGGPAPVLAPVPFGMEDRPGEQAQAPAWFDLAGGSHLVVAGSARSGRSTVLRTLAASLARTISPDDLHLYGLDFGNGALLPLTALPHCGAVVLRSENERAERLIGRLAEELARRQEYLARRGFGDISEQRAAAPAEERLPYVVVLLDRWEGFMATYPMESGSTLPATVARLVREGVGAGLRLVVSGDRSLLSDRMASQIEDRLVLRLADREDFRLANLNPRQIAEDMPPGRALRADSGLEIQIAVLDRPRAGAGDETVTSLPLRSNVDPAAQAQAEAVRAIGVAVAQRWPAPRRVTPLRVDVMPATVTLGEMRQMVLDGRSNMPVPIPEDGLWSLIGVGGDEVQAFGIDLSAVGGFVVAGPPRSGRSTALSTLAVSLGAHHASVVVVYPRPSPLAALKGRTGITAVLAGTVPGDRDLMAAIEAAPAPVAVVIDDADTFARTEADEALRTYVRDVGPAKVVVAVGGPIDELKTELRGAIAEARRAKTGILLSPASAFDGDLFGMRVPGAFLDRMPPGRGCLVLGGTCTLVQVALPEGA
ncbi:MAG: FtsK/SpoIIIE domain-containing protein [Acidimicrobiales bacterium]